MKKWIMLLILCALLTSYCAFAEPQRHFQRSSVIQSIHCFDHAVYCSEADGIFRVDLADGSTAYYAYSQPVDQLTLFEHDGRLTAIAKADSAIGLYHISFEGESAVLNLYCSVSSFPSGDQWIEAIAGTGTYSVFTIQKKLDGNVRLAFECEYRRNSVHFRFVYGRLFDLYDHERQHSGTKVFPVRFSGRAVWHG